jgi:predicted dinucleotide-binding enzyme
VSASVGSALGERLTDSGYEVAFGVRPGKEIGELLERCHGRARAASVRDAAAGAEIVFKQRVADLARRCGFAPWDAGPLECAGLLESLALLWIRRALGGAGRRFVFQPVDDEQNGSWVTARGEP